MDNSVANNPEIWKSFLHVADKYIQASKNLIDKMIETENSLSVISDHEVTDEEVYESTRYNSFSIIMPAIFCLYQGIELILKGFTYKLQPKKNSHKAEIIFQDFCEYYPCEKGLINLFREFLDFPVNFIHEYKEKNLISSVEAFYNSLRYPDPIDYDYTYLYYFEEDLIQLETLRSKIDEMMQLSAKLFHEIN